MKTIRLGKNGPVVSQFGLGCMAMSDMYGPSDESESIATIHAALDAGINMLDTGDFYGMGHNEMLIRRAIEGRRKDVFLAVKFGAMRGPDGSFSGYDLRPEAVKNFLSYSLRSSARTTSIFTSRRVSMHARPSRKPTALSPVSRRRDTFATSASPKPPRIRFGARAKPHPSRRSRSNIHS